jgi:two-component system OmpR family sensor kinase
MSSSQLADSRRTDRGRRPRRVPRLADWSLRAKLVAQLLVLLAVLCLVIGVFTELALRQFLIDRLDQQLDAATDRSSAAFSHPPPFPDVTGPGPTFLLMPGQGPGTLGVLVDNGVVRQAAVLPTQVGQPVALTRQQTAAVLSVPPDRLPRTVTVPGLGDFRVAAMPTPEGGTAITGLPLSGVADTLLQAGLILGAVALVGLIAAGVVGLLVVRRTLRPLERVAATAGRVAELPLDRGEVALSVRVPDTDTNPRTEVGKVGAALNQMLGHVGRALAARHASETRVRRFVADASHELRTPLAAIRGYAELTRPQRADLPPQVAHALTRVESESVRMTSLVEELLLLARLDAGRPVRREPVDLSRLLADAVADAHAAGPDHRWRLAVPGDELTVLGDPGQLHQVVANLLANARAHTPAGTTVTATLTRDRHRAVVTVRDDGPGIPPELLPEVFERFARGDGSRSRAAGSTGLGLAIVAAVVCAHGGTVHVTSTPGRTEFTVTLPLDPTPP